MLCRVYTTAGQLVMEGPCGVRRDGGLSVVPVRARRSLHAGEGPLLVAAGTQRFPARVASVQPPEVSPVGAAVYHLAPTGETSGKS